MKVCQRAQRRRAPPAAMLLPLLAGFLNAHYVNVLLLNALLAAATFFWTYSLALDDLPRYWALWAGGVALAVAVRAALRRLRVSLLPTLGIHDCFREFIVAALAFVALTFYDQKIEDPASSLAEPYASGAVTSLLVLWVVLVGVELFEYYAGMPRREFSPLSSENAQAALVCTLVVALDLVAFMHGAVVVGLAAGALLACFVVGVTLEFVMGVRSL